MDGDTLRVGWEDREMTLRLFGVNAPERGQRCHDEARERTLALSGKTVRLVFDERRRDRFGRLLAYAFAEDGRFIDGDLVARGLGRAWRRDGRFKGTLAALEEEARRRGAGCLWAGRRAP
jgi:endonuclease YncB( thermonuclease family)